MMFRVSLISLCLVAANANLFKSSTRLLAQDIKRQLQEFDLDAFQFNFAGININAEVAQENCPTQWQNVISCVISDCPQFMDVCPDLEVPAEFQGTAAPVPENLPEIDGEAVDDMMGGNMTMPHNDTAAVMTPDMPVDPADEVPTCEEIELEFCDAFVQEDVEDCCLLDCAEQLQGLVNCLVLELTGEDRSDCEIPTCPTPAPGGTTTTDGTTAPAGGTSSAVSVVSRISVLAASAFAFVML